MPLLGVAVLEILLVAEVLVESVILRVYKQRTASEVTEIFGINPLTSLTPPTGLLTFTCGGVVSLTNATRLKCGINISTDLLLVVFQQGNPDVVSCPGAKLKAHCVTFAVDGVIPKLA